jgi:transcriptional regulator with XRE-family HTH domain
MNISVRGKQIREYFGESQDAFGLRIGVAQKNVSNNEKRNSDDVSGEYLKGLLSIEGINPNWVLYGVSDMFLKEGEKYLPISNKKLPDDINKILQELLRAKDKIIQLQEEIIKLKSGGTQASAFGVQ